MCWKRILAIHPVSILMVDDKKNGSGLKIPRFFQQKQTKQQEFVESAPPEKARSLRDLPEGGFIKKETEH